MAPTCCQPIVDRYRYRPIFKLGSQPPKSPASLDAIALGCAARFNLSKLDEPASMDSCRFQGPPAVGQFLSSGCMADLSEDGEIFDSDDGLPLPPGRSPPRQSRWLISSPMMTGVATDNRYTDCRKPRFNIPLKV